MDSYTVNINGIEVNASYSDRAVSSIFMPLLRHLTALQQEKKDRIVVFLSAPPGAGKSTLASYLEKLSRDHDDICDIRAVGMDGFHRRQEYLLSHTVDLDGKEIPMVDIKGAPITFDLEKLTEAIRRVSAGEDCKWPSYDRHLHNPVEGTYTIKEKIVLIEGNYLLINREGWRDLRNFADYTIKVTAEGDFLRNRLIDRKIKSGNSNEKAERFVDFSDMANVRVCLAESGDADLTLALDDRGEYSVQNGSPAGFRI